MDDSKQNIEMCRKAVEVQKFWKQLDKHHSAINRKSGDYIQTLGENIWIVLFEPHAGVFTLSDKYAHVCTTQWNFDDIIWLPRQDQLQDMLIPFNVPGNTESYGKDCHNLALHFRNWIINTSWQYIIKLVSMEQLWLAFVMKEKFNKTWNGEDWIFNGKADQQN